MSGKATKPRSIKTVPELQQAVILRTAGYSLQSISLKLNISCSTLSRHFSTLAVPKGSIDAIAVAAAKQQLLNDSGFINGLREAIAGSIVDDLSHCAALRSAMAITLEDMMQDAATPATYKARGIAALTTALALTQKASRVALQADDQPIEQETLPELLISELTLENIEEMRKEQLVTAGLDDVTHCDMDEIVEES